MANPLTGCLAKVPGGEDAEKIKYHASLHTSLDCDAMVTVNDEQKGTRQDATQRAPCPPSSPQRIVRFPFTSVISSQVRLFLTPFLLLPLCVWLCAASWCVSRPGVMSAVFRRNWGRGSCWAGLA
ncbi:hypothetical protein E2C01_038632 [Portunus trituberculatus]|uniref:Uncharacterized protein n=1 Tax=Portunus trituberculatus TaxID=210409 RepID=A0A5B7FIG4_PORTR|nr:hypothetical protein [Portunus trituberculatus]